VTAHEDDGDAGDAALARAARAGNRDAFALLVTRHYALLRALCRRMLGDTVPAEEAAQEAVLQAMLAVDGLRRPEQFGPWLAGIGLNVCRRMLRERAHGEWSWEALRGGSLAHEPIDNDPSPAEFAEEAELRERVRRAVAALPRGQRAAVTLYYLHGLSHRATAAHLGVPLGAVKTRLYKARATLRMELAGVWREEEMSTTDATGVAPGTSLVEMRVFDVRAHAAGDDKGGAYVVLLQEVDGARFLLVWVGHFEGENIALNVRETRFPRPLTFTFMGHILDALGGRLREIQITRLAEDVFYATAVVEGPHGTKVVEARPSDAINLALTAGAPILVDRAVLAAVGRDTPPDTTGAAGQGEGAAGIVADITVRTASVSPALAFPPGENA